MKLGRALLCLALAALCACRRSEPPKAAEKPAPPPPRLRIVTDRVSLETLEKVPLDDAVRLRPDVFRLRPDRRFLIALGELELLVTGAPNAQLHLAWTGNAWRIDSAGAPLGEVPELASYAQLRRLLADRAQTLVAARASALVPAATPERDAIRKDGEAFDAESQVRALQAIDAVWPASGLPDSELASLAARAAVSLSIQSFDTLELADLLRARALALLALAEAAGAPPSPADEAVLAASFGYRSDAAAIATALPGDDPVRLYTENRTTRLVDAANRDDASPMTRYLALASLGERQDRAAWSNFVNARFKEEQVALPVLKTAAALESFEINASLGHATLYAALDQLGGRPKDAGPAIWMAADAGPVGQAVGAFVAQIQARQKVQAIALVKVFEERLAGASAGARGRLWDAHAMRAWHRGALYSGLERLGKRYLENLGSADSTRELIEYLQDSPQGIASQFARWYSDISGALLGKPVYDQLYDDLLTLNALGGPAVHDIARHVRGKDYIKFYGAPVLSERLAGRLDARPSNVGFVNETALNPLWDLPRVEETCRAWLAFGWRDEGTTGRCLRFLNDERGLAAITQDSALDLRIRAEMLETYCNITLGASETLCRRGFRSLGEESGYDERVVEPWIRYSVAKVKNYPEAQRAAEGYLSRHDRSEGLSWYYYGGLLARTLSLQGRDREAWKVIEPLIGSGQGGVMAWAAEILQKLGRTEEAYTLAQQAVDRYPDSDYARMAMTVILWRQKRYSEAALVLDPPEKSYKVGYYGYRDYLASRFLDVFAKASDGEAESAIEALHQQGIQSFLVAAMVPAVADSGRAELAFRIQSSLIPKGQHLWDVASWKAKGFQLLEKSRGKGEAVAWIQAAIPERQREAFLEGFLNAEAGGLLWDAVPPAEEPKQTEWVWLMRAGAATSDPEVARAHRGDLLVHYSEAGNGEINRTLGRYLLGLEPRSAVLAVVKTPEDRCKAAYFFGLEEFGRGRYREASDWISLVYDGCWRTSWKFNSLAFYRLARWASVGRPVEVAATQKVWSD